MTSYHQTPPPSGESVVPTIILLWVEGCSKVSRNNNFTFLPLFRRRRPLLHPSLPVILLSKYGFHSSRVLSWMDSVFQQYRNNFLTLRVVTPPTTISTFFASSEPEIYKTCPSSSSPITVEGRGGTSNSVISWRNVIWGLPLHCLPCYPAINAIIRIIQNLLRHFGRPPELPPPPNDRNANPFQ